MNLLVQLLILISSQAYAGTSYTKDVAPLFQKRCVQCHNASSTVPNWTDYQTAYVYRDKIDERVFLKKDMPLGNATGMTEDERKLVHTWVSEGSPR